MLHMQDTSTCLKPCISKLKVGEKIAVDQNAFEGSPNTLQAWPYSRLSCCLERCEEGKDCNDVPNGSERRCSSCKKY